jgi:hypothetical protein
MDTGEYSPFEQADVKSSPFNHSVLVVRLQHTVELAVSRSLDAAAETTTTVMEGSIPAVMVNAGKELA